MSEQKDVELKIGKPDEEGQLIRTIYARQTGRYAVYATADRLKVWFADDPRLQLLLRRRLLAISKLRSQISGLQSTLNAPSRTRRLWYWLLRKPVPANGGMLAHWRDPTAFAIVDALEGHAEGANETLTYVHAQLLAARLSRARLDYLMWGLATVCVVMMLAGTVAQVATESVYCVPILQNLMLAVAIGALGAFFSIARSISSRTIRIDGQGYDSFVDVFTRILVGCISAFVLEALLDSHLISFSFGSQSLVAKAEICANTNLTSWPVTIVAAFLAGFAEKLIPDLMARYADQTSGPGRSQLPVAPTGVGTGGLGSAGAMVPSSIDPTSATGPLPDDPEGIDAQPSAAGDARANADENGRDLPGDPDGTDNAEGDAAAEPETASDSHPDLDGAKDSARPSGDGTSVPAQET